MFGLAVKIQQQTVKSLVQPLLLLIVYVGQCLIRLFAMRRKNGSLLEFLLGCKNEGTRNTWQPVV